MTKLEILNILKDELEKGIVAQSIHTRYLIREKALSPKDAMIEFDNQQKQSEYLEVLMKKKLEVLEDVIKELNQ
jgi:hypothetical protein